MVSYIDTLALVDKKSLVNLGSWRVLQANPEQNTE
jgi:hypothetical protein